jgi:uncharacterized Ntn-hydrolase superfamily protein
VTYSIVARDAKTGEFGVAVQSHYFQVGPVVPWALSGVGAVATQSRVNVSYGPLGLEFLRSGYTAAEALKALTSGDSQPEIRQCAIVDAAGSVAAHTGSKCVAAAGHQMGDGFSCQANLMEKDTVWAAMAEAFESAEGPLAERMMVALEAAEAEGGDIRGKQSAAMLVVSGKPTGRSWEDRIIDLRVDDAAEPLPELRRLLRIKRAVQTVPEADRLTTAGDLAGAARKRSEGLALAPEMIELRFWNGIAMARAGDFEDGMKLLEEVVSKDPRWLETMRRLVAVDRVSEELAMAVEGRLASAATRPR